MKKLIFTLTLCLSVICSQAQFKGTGTDTVNFMKVNTDSVRIAGPQIWSFYITSDTSRLHPVDTLYSTEGNKSYQQILYTYKDGKKDMLITVKNYNDGRFWRFASFSVEEIRQHVGAISLQSLNPLYFDHSLTLLNDTTIQSKPKKTPKKK